MSRSAAKTIGRPTGSFPRSSSTSTSIRNAPASGRRSRSVRNGDHDRPLRLDGDELELISVKVDGESVPHRIDGQQLVIDIAGNRATVETEVVITRRPTPS